MTENCTVPTICGREILSEASPICLMYLMRFWNTSWAMDDIPYSVVSHLLYSMAAYLKYGVLVCAIWELMTMEIGKLRPICGWQKLSEASFLCIVHLRMVLKHFISNGCVSVWYNTPFALSTERVPKSGILCAIWEVISWITYRHSETHSRQTDVIRSTSYLPYVP